MPSERRRIKRNYIMFYTRVFDAPTGKLLGHLVDITPEGMMLISEQQLAANTAFRLKIELTPELDTRSFLEFGARCLWCRQDINPRFYNSGFQLPGLAPADVAVIERIVEAYGFHDN
jgi:PilZ domain